MTTAAAEEAGKDALTAEGEIGGGERKGVATVDEEVANKSGKEENGGEEKAALKEGGDGEVEVEEQQTVAGGEATREEEQIKAVVKEAAGDKTIEKSDEDEGKYGGGESLVGRKTSKRFGRRTFGGLVVSFDAEQKWYKVVYEDGDEEELEWLELKRTLRPVAQASPSKTTEEVVKKAVQVSPRVAAKAIPSPEEPPLGKRKRERSVRLTESLSLFGNSLTFRIPRAKGKNKAKAKEKAEKAETDKVVEIEIVDDEETEPAKEGEKEKQAAEEAKGAKGKEALKETEQGKEMEVEKGVVDQVAAVAMVEAAAVVVEKVVAGEVAVEAGAVEEVVVDDGEVEVEVVVVETEEVAVAIEGKESMTQDAGTAVVRNVEKETKEVMELGAGTKTVDLNETKTKEKSTATVKKGEKRKGKEVEEAEKATKLMSGQKPAQKRQKTAEKGKRSSAEGQKSSVDKAVKTVGKDKKKSDVKSEKATLSSENRGRKPAADKTKKMAANGGDKAAPKGTKPEEKKGIKSAADEKATQSPGKGPKTVEKKTKASQTAANPAEMVAEGVDGVVSGPAQDGGGLGEKPSSDKADKGGTTSLAKGKQSSPSSAKKSVEKKMQSSAKKNEPHAEEEGKSSSKATPRKRQKREDKTTASAEAVTVQETSDSKRSIGPGKTMIRRKVRKLFADGKHYTGEVVSYDGKYHYYKVQYDDGDQEELVWSELEPALVALPAAALKEKAESPMNVSPSVKRRQGGGSGASKNKQTPGNAEGSGEGGASSPLKRKRAAQGENGRVDPKESESKTKTSAGSPKRVSRPKIVKMNTFTGGKGASPSNDNSAAAPPKPFATGAGRATSGRQQFVIVSSSPSSSPPPTPERDTMDYYAWGEVAQFVKGRLPPLQAAELLPVSTPISQLAVSHHHMAAITTSGHVFVWRNRHGNIFSRANEWEFVPDLENKDIHIVDIAGPDLDRKQSGYEPEQEDQVPDPFYLAAVDKNGQDYVLVGSQAQEKPVRTMRLTEEPRYPGLRDALALTDSAAAAEVGQVLQLSVGTVEAPDESPFIGYITDRGRVYIRSATKDFMEEVNIVTGYTGKPIKIQCGRVYHAIILTDDGCAWTWGRSSFPGMSDLGIGPLCDTSDSQTSLATCQIATGSLLGRKVIDVGCYGEDFVALTSDGSIHQWTYATSDSARGVYNFPSLPHPDNEPRITSGEKLVKVSVGAGVCAGITVSGRVHTWRNGMSGALVGVSVPLCDALTPLGRNEDAQTTDTSVSTLGSRIACDVKCVVGSFIIGVSKKARAKSGAKRKVETQ